MMQSAAGKIDIGKAIALTRAGRPVTEKMYGITRPAIILDPCKGIWCEDVTLTVESIGAALGISAGSSDEGLPFRASVLTVGGVRLLAYDRTDRQAPTVVTRDGETLCTGACVFIGMCSPLSDEDIDAIMGETHVGSWLGPQGRLLAVTRVWGSA